MTPHEFSERMNRDIEGMEIGMILLKDDYTEEEYQKTLKSNLELIQAFEEGRLSELIDRSDKNGLD